jgi:hypothetical protein
MFLSYIILSVALLLSGIAAYYSIVGLTTIFAGAAMAVTVMGIILEVAKVSVTVWLHEYWKECRLVMKLYLLPSVFILMVITSMGIYGLLSKSHLDQGITSGDIAAQVSIYDEKIKIQRDNIDIARKAMEQMDSQVDARLIRGTSESSAERAVQIRRQQAKERQQLQNDIVIAQQEISKLTDSKAPIAAQLRQTEAEVGPIKYIAALIYGGEQLDQNLLESAVRWVIILIVVVFDPLAITMILAATESFKWERQRKEQKKIENANLIATFTRPDTREPSVPLPPVEVEETATEVPKVPEPIVDVVEETATEVPEPIVDVVEVTDVDIELAAKRAWKSQHPDRTIKEQRIALDTEKIEQLPWLDAESLKAAADAIEDVAFGITFPAKPIRGNLFVRTDFLPTKLFRFNGSIWMEVDKDITDSFTYNDAYIDYLVAKVESGEYDVTLLTDNEQHQIELKFQNAE